MLKEFILAVSAAAAAGEIPVETNDDNGCLPACRPFVKLSTEGKPDVLGSPGILGRLPAPLNILLGLVNAPVNDAPAPVNAPPDNRFVIELDPDVAEGIWFYAALDAFLVIDVSPPSVVVTPLVDSELEFTMDEIAD